MLGVLAFHLLAIERKYSGGDLLLPDVFRLGQSGVDLFFVISGFVMVMVTKGRFASGKEMKRFIWGRFTRIYPTYWFYFLLTLGVFLIRPGLVNASQGHQAPLLASFLLLPSEQLPLVMVAWSLIHELWFYLVFALFLRSDEKWLGSSLVFWGAAVLAVNAFTDVAGLSPAVRIACHPYTLEFIIGALVALAVSKRPPGLSLQAALWLAGSALLVALPAAYCFDILEEKGVGRAIMFGGAYGVLLFSCVVLEKKCKPFVPHPLVFIGDISYTVYLSHILVLSALGRLWLMINPNPYALWDNMLAVLAMLAAVVGYGWFGYRVIELPLLDASHRLRERWFAASPSRSA